MFLQTWLNCEPNVELFYTKLSSDYESSTFALANFILERLNLEIHFEYV